jgi:hypothetical protein
MKGTIMSQPSGTLVITSPVIQGEIVEEYNPNPRVGDLIASRMHRTLDELPEQTILQSFNGEGDEKIWDTVAYRCTTFEWTVAGNDRPVTSDQLSTFAPEWTVVRIGE